MSSNRRKLLFLSPLLIALAGFTAIAADGLKQGDAAPPFNSFTLEGAVPNTAGKVVIVDFWASWCGPCAASFPELEKIYQKYKARGLVVIGVSVDEDPAKMAAFLEKHKVSFSTVRDAQHKLVATYNLGTMPASAVIGRDGRIAAIHHGFKGKSTVEEVEKELESLLGAAK
jgi:peroxiredoxin